MLQPIQVRKLDVDHLQQCALSYFENQTEKGLTSIMNANAQQILSIITDWFKVLSQNLMHSRYPTENYNPSTCLHFFDSLSELPPLNGL